LFVGRGTRCQIWDPAAHDVYNASAFARARNRGATLSLRAADAGEEGS